MFTKYKSSLKLLNIWVLLGAIVVAIALMLGLLSLLSLTRVDNQSTGPATAVLNVIEVINPTVTTQISVPTPSVPSSSEVPPPPSPGEISVGNSVQISGTGGDGLRLRSSAGLQGEVLFLGYEGEVFQVLDGPRELDGYIWWYLSAPYDEKVQGWAVSNYITVLQNP